MTHRLPAAILAFSVLALLPGGGSFAQSTGELQRLQEQIEALREGQNAIQQQLQEIQRLLRLARQAPDARNVVLRLAEAPVKGDPKARVTLVEFSDYQCPFCARHARATLPEIEREYVRTGKVKYVFRDFPIESIHPQAFKAHEAANCAGEQDKYWEMHRRLFANQGALAPADLTGHAQAIGLDGAKFAECVSSGRFAGKIRQSLLEGQQAGARGTPTFFVGLSEDDGSVKAWRTIVGAQPFESFRQAIDSLLAERPVTP